jgi:hypothetical protein
MITHAEADVLLRQPEALRFSKQREVREDTSDLIALFCSRRAGKTEEFVFEAAESLAGVRDGHVVFIGLSAKSAWQIFFSKFKRLNVRNSWGFEFNEQNLSVFNPQTGSVCLVFGSDNRADIEKILGLSKVVLLILDEAGAWRQGFLKYVIEEVAGPCLEDVPGGRTVIGGTPGRILSGYWYDITMGKIPGYSVHSWTLEDNPYMPLGILEKVKKKFGWTDETPEFIRQYLGRWALDPSTLVFSGFSDKNIVPSPWDKSYDSILSIDFGVVHSTSFILLSHKSYDIAVRVPWSEKRAGMAPSEVADEARALKAQYGCTRMIGDLGGMGKAYAQEMQARHHLTIEPADKRDKLALIEMVNDGFRQGHLVVDPRNTDLIRELRSLQWDELHEDIADGQADDLVDALCYGYQQVRHRYVKPPDPKDEPIFFKPRPRPHWAVDLGAR